MSANYHILLALQLLNATEENPWESIVLSLKHSKKAKLLSVFYQRLFSVYNQADDTIHVGKPMLVIEEQIKKKDLLTWLKKA